MNSSFQSEQLFDTFLTIQELSQSNVDEARKVFLIFYEKGVFKDCSFDDNKWNGTDEYSNVGINYNVNRFCYERSYQDIFRLSYEEFVEYLKVFVAFTLGKNVLKTLQTVVNDIKRIIKTERKEFYGATANLKIATPSLCIDFFSILPNNSDNKNVEKLIDVLEFYITEDFKRGVKKQRSLAQFDSYFLFNDILSDFWKRDISNDTRLFYYPIYLWWRITAIIPLRPKEFILTPRNCLKKEDDGYYLTLKRNRLKGGNKEVSYKISTDYYDVTYKIPEVLANEIMNYHDFTKQYEKTQIDTFFVSDPHYKKWRQKKHLNSRFLTYTNINTIIRYFFYEIIQNEYGLKTIYGRSERHLKRDEINYIHLGDTRHLALINIMAEGGTPVTAMLLAGHDNIEMSAHYYSNITNLIECRTYRQYRQISLGEVTYQLSSLKKFPIIRENNFKKLSHGGRCFSEKFYIGDYSDCFALASKEGEIGYCPDCKFYRKSSSSFFSTDDGFYKRKIEDDCKKLEDAIHLVRIGKGDTEDIGEALLNLKSSSFSYQEYFEEKTARFHAKGEKIWQEED